MDGGLSGVALVGLELAAGCFEIGGHLFGRASDFQDQGAFVFDVCKGLEESWVIDEVVDEGFVFDPGFGVDVVDVKVEYFGAEAIEDGDGGVVVGFDGRREGAGFGRDFVDFDVAALVADVDGGADVGVIDGLDEGDEIVDGLGEAGFDGDFDAELAGAVGPARDDFDVLVLAGFPGFLG